MSDVLPELQIGPQHFTRHLNPAVENEGDCPGCKRIRVWAESAYSRGYMRGEHDKENNLRLTREALKKEQEERWEDNARLTADLLAAEARIEQLEKELHGD